MKKFFPIIALVLLLAGCTNKYDDSDIKARLDAIETRLVALEGNIQSLQSAIGDGVFVAKVQEYADPATGKTVGVTVTYTSGDVKYFEISPKADYDGPVLGVIRNGAGDLVWAVDGIAIKMDDKDVTVYQTPVFTVDEDGNLRVSVDGSEPVVLGQVQNEGATLVDGIFTDIKVEQDKIVLTLSDNTKVNVPFAEPFKLTLESEEAVYAVDGTFTVYYTLTGATEGTTVKVAGYNPFDFNVEVKADNKAIEITPLKDDAAAQMLVVADSGIGMVSTATLQVEPEGVFVTNSESDEHLGLYDYWVEGEGDLLQVNVVSNVEFDVITSDDWIQVVSVKSHASTITLDIEENATGSSRFGAIALTKPGVTRETVTEADIYQTVTIYQAKMAEGPKELSKKESANCYVITAAGDYKFAPVKGNSSESVGAVAKAELYWETYNNAEEVAVNSIIASVGFDDGFITFSTPETLKAGNAVIAAKDASDVILWSWHIWVPATEIASDTYGIYSTALMDRNLGALVAAPADAEAPVESFGFLYQWGRKDPFPGPAATSGSGFAKTTGPAPSQLDGDGETEACKITLEQSIQNPLLMGRMNSKDWITPADNALWTDEAKTMYDPCPPGYRVPARISDQPLHSSDFTAVAGWTESKANHSFTMGSPAAVFPFAGYLDDYGPADGVAKNGLRVLYWTAHKSDDNAAYGMNVRETTSGGNAHKLSTAGKARGGSVRCAVIAAE